MRLKPAFYDLVNSVEKGNNWIHESIIYDE